MGIFGLPLGDIREALNSPAMLDLCSRAATGSKSALARSYQPFSGYTPASQAFRAHPGVRLRTCGPAISFWQSRSGNLVLIEILLVVPAGYWRAGLSGQFIPKCHDAMSRIFGTIVSGKTTWQDERTGGRVAWESANRVQTELGPSRAVEDMDEGRRVLLKSLEGMDIEEAFPSQRWPVRDALLHLDSERYVDALEKMARGEMEMLPPLYLGFACIIRLVT